MQELLDQIANKMRGKVERGKVASYIPELAGVDPAQFAIAVIRPDGEIFQAGNSTQRFSIQSISKVFTLCMAMEQLGRDLWHRVGREPSGDPFNSIVQLEAERGIPRNPLINAGAIVVADCLSAKPAPLQRYLAFMKRISGQEIMIDPTVAHSESATGYRNRSLAHFMKAERNLKHDVEHVLDFYFSHCATSMSTVELAMSGRFLAFGGRVDDAEITPLKRVRRLLSLMMCCGHYDASGSFAYRVGLAAKSGVGGGILAIAPGRASIAVWSPGLGAKGNSLLGTEALEILARETGWSVFSEGSGV